MESQKVSRCSHVVHVTLSKESINKFTKSPKCAECQAQKSGKHMWLCLHQDCHYVGCGERVKDHSTQHQNSENHPLAMNLSNFRIWCSECNFEVYEHFNVPSFSFLSTQQASAKPSALVDTSSGSEDENATDQDASRGLTGLRNLGNTCYMNAAVQALSSCPQLTRFFLDCSNLVRYCPVLSASGAVRKTTPLAHAYSNLIKEMWSVRSTGIIAPSSLLHTVRVVHPTFKGFQQQDSQEFLRFFMDQVHEEIKYPVTVKNETGGVTADGDQTTGQDNETREEVSDDIDAASVDSMSSASGMVPPSVPDSLKSNDAKRKTLRRFYRSIITDIFNGSLSSVVQCQTCETRSTTNEIFQDLSLPIPSGDHLAIVQKRGTGVANYSPHSWLNPLWVMVWFKNMFIGPHISLQDCLEAFFSSDELKGDNMYSCSKCKKLRNGVKFSRLLSLPEVLSIHLKRFRHDFHFSTKISSHVTFPLEGLSLDAYLHRECRSRGTLYDLVAVICHHGSTAGGHYTSLALNYRNQQWYEFDDSYVTKVDINSVLSSQAYVLFYRKRDTAMFSLREKAVSLLKSAKVDAGLMSFYISRQWINKFNTFGDPGPITNDSFLCPHGALPPAYSVELDSLVMEVPYELWTLLSSKFGGGPVVTRLMPCSICETEDAQLTERRQTEFDTVLQEYKIFRNDAESAAVFALNSRWFRSWEEFAKGKELDPPGPIDNSSILTKRGDALRQNADYYPVSRRIWSYFLERYGGGPELCLKEEEESPTEEESPLEADLDQD